ncbi:hypothetical protein LY76DRAFT_594734 [Colletotrichum caudatum]|nr:hypothetical protein LY76DRAFT_594734 [Colletotrichum caudatum]
MQRKGGSVAWDTVLTSPLLVCSSTAATICDATSHVRLVPQLDNPALTNPPRGDDRCELTLELASFSRGNRQLDWSGRQDLSWPRVQPLIL